MQSTKSLCTGITESVRLIYKYIFIFVSSLQYGLKFS